MLRYFNPVILNDSTISVDKLSIQFSAADELFDVINTNQYLNEVFPWLIFSETDSRRYCFRYFYKVNYSTGIMTVMLCHNSNDQRKCRIEVNPNNCFNDPNCIQNIQELLMYSTCYYINQLDLAIDIPKSPDLITILKDQRASFQFSRSKNDHTEYLGKNRNKPGHVKKYNKAQKCNLDHPLTRIEVTVGNPADQKFRKDLIRYLPETYVRVSAEITDDLNLTDLKGTKRVLVKALLSHPDKLKLWHELGKKMRIKIKPYIFSDVTEFIYDIESVIKASNEMIKILSFDFARLDIFRVL